MTDHPKHLKRCDASPYGAPCICPMAEHTLRFLGDNVTLSRSQWEELREQMLENAYDAKRIDDMLSRPREDRAPACPDCDETDMARWTGDRCQHLTLESPGRACKGCPNPHACQYGRICRHPAQSSVLIVPGTDAPLDELLAPVPDDAHAMDYLMQDGNLAVPGGRYGHDTAACAPVALLVAKIMRDATGEPMTYHGLDSDMSSVVNSSDGVAELIWQHARGLEIDPADYLSEEDIEAYADMESMESYEEWS